MSATRTRLPRQERIDRILEVSIRQIGERGFFGLSLQTVADEVGMTLPGMLHYIGSKEGLLQLIIEQRYDRRFDPEQFVASGAAGAVHADGPSFPAYLRYLVAHNAREPELVRLFMVLSAESASPAHPAHSSFQHRPDAVWELYSRTAWRLPPEIGGWQRMRPLVELSIEAMDGVQLRSFREPAIDMPTGWLAFERVLFPAPLWDDYR